MGFLLSICRSSAAGRSHCVLIPSPRDQKRPPFGRTATGIPLRSNKILAARRRSLADVPALMTTEERFELLLRRLKSPDRPRPAKHKTLVSTIQGTFDRALDPEIVEKAVALLIHKGILKLADTGRVSYPG